MSRYIFRCQFCDAQLGAGSSMPRWRKTPEPE